MVNVCANFSVPELLTDSEFVAVGKLMVAILAF